LTRINRWSKIKEKEAVVNGTVETAAFNLIALFRN
jgi:hypothetical protein